MTNTLTVKAYKITGYTKAGKFVCTGFGTQLKEIVAYFIEKYPRFKGDAEIELAYLERSGEMLIDRYSTAWQILDSFESTKELKNYGV